MLPLEKITAAKSSGFPVPAKRRVESSLAASAAFAFANGVKLETVGRNLLHSPPSPDWQVMLVADLFYEKPVAELMLRWLAQARENGSAVYIADASRPFTPRTGVEVLMEEKYSTDKDLEGSANRMVRLLAYLP